MQPFKLDLEKKIGLEFKIAIKFLKLQGWPKGWNAHVGGMQELLITDGHGPLITAGSSS